jgi:SAM-dependent methyltransferase
VSASLENEVQRSIEPAVRLVLAAIFALVAVLISIFELAGDNIPWIKQNPWLWAVVFAAAVVSAFLLAAPTRRAPSDNSRLLSLRPSENEASAQEYRLADCVKFYNRIAEVYDARLTRENLDTLRTAARKLLSCFSEQSQTLSVLDIGAGTGQFLKVLEGAHRVKWTCIEPSAGMASVLRRFFEGPPVDAEVLEIGWEDASRYLQGRRCDAISLNFVLSSLPELPDFSILGTLLAPNGIIVISDGHPNIRASTVSFRIRAADGVHALNIQHQSPEQIAHSLTMHGHFEEAAKEENITKKGKLYSFVLCYRKSKSFQSIASEA